MSNDIGEWITPAQASDEMSRRAGYEITPDDIRQLKRLGRIKQVRKIGTRITLYNLGEIHTVTPPKKRNPRIIASYTADRQARFEHGAKG